MDMASRSHMRLIGKDTRSYACLTLGHRYKSVLYAPIPLGRYKDTKKIMFGASSLFHLEIIAPMRCPTLHTQI